MTRKLSRPQMVSYLAIAAGLIATQAPAADKGLLGSWTVNSGDVGISESTDVTNVFVNSSQAVIDWMPDDNATGTGTPITFLDTNGTVNFRGFTDYAVLNRIGVADASRQVLLNGQINGFIGQNPGGNIFFYSPSGFIVGSNAAINVGSLVLSASPIAVTDGSFIVDGTVTFGQAPNPSAAITTAAGSDINAFGAGSYVALVAPQITHSGTIRTDTAAALVAAEAATINFSPDGLFNIQVTVGADPGNRLHVDGGTITRNNPENVGDHRAYLVAVAKNDAVTMLIENGGSIGFETASSATVENNVVVLSGGGGVFNGTPFVSGSANPVNLAIDSSTFSSDVYADISGGADIRTSTGSTSFGSDPETNSLTLFASDDSIITAVNGNSLSFAGDLFVNIDEFGTGPITTGNQLRLSASGTGSRLTVGANAFLSAATYGADDGEGTAAGDATGGTVIVQTGSGTEIDIAGLLDINVDGHGGTVNGFDAVGGDGTGGKAHILANGGSSSISVGGDVIVSAIGNGGTTGECSSCLVTGGNGTGGEILVHAQVGIGNSLLFGGDVELSAIGEGGAGDVIGGTGTGGIVDVISAEAGSIDVAGDFTAFASGEGGPGLFFTGGDGGDGIGNRARINATGGDITIDGSVLLDVSGTGGNGTVGGDGIGGGNFFTDSGGAHIFARNGDILIGGSARVRADGTGGNGAEGGDGGDGTGGWASIHAANGTAGASSITIQAVEEAAFASANGTGGDGGDGVSGTRGEDGVSGSDGGTGGDGGNGGTGTGGVAAITASAGNGTINVDFGFVDANGTGGAGGAGGTGGAGGIGGDGPGGNGGAGGLGGSGGAAFGGLASAGVESGTAQAPGSNAGTANFVDVEVTASALGGEGGSGGLGGAAGIGFPEGAAGADGGGGAGGYAEGGIAELQVRGGTVNLSNALLTSTATGGDGGTGAIDGAGGDAESDEAYVLVTNRTGNGALRGTLNAGSIIGVVTSTGGTGSESGVGLMEGGSGFYVFNGDADIGSVDFTITADGQIADLATDSVVLINADVVVDSFELSTDGVASIYANDTTPITPSLTAGTFSVTASNFVHDERPFPDTVGVISADTINLTTTQNLIVDAHLISTSSLNLTAPGLIDVEDATSGDTLTLDAGSTISGGTMTAANSITANAGGDIGLNFVIAGSDIDIESTGGSIATSAQSAGGFDGEVFRLGDIALTAVGEISTGDLSATGSVDGDAGGSLTTQDINAFGPVTLTAAGSIGTGNVDADSVAMNAGTDISAGDIFAFGSVDLDAIGSILTGDITAFTIDLLAGEDITTDDLTTQLGEVLQTQGVGALLFPGASITLEAGGDIATGDISSRDGVYAQAGGSISTGAIDAVDFVEAHGVGGVSTGDIDAGDYILLTSDNGAISVASAVTPGSFLATAGTNLTAGAVSADTIDATAGGTATVNGNWSAIDVRVTSNDIDIAATGSIVAGDISLISTNAARTIVGDGIDLTGYRLSNAEYNRLSSNDINVIADSALGAAPSMLIGDLSVDASDGEGINDYEFITGDSESETAEGSIRILGDMVFTGMSADEAVSFTTGTFELDAATGLLSLEGAPGALGGTLFLNAANIHVASGEILDQLAADPQYQGYQDDLNDPAAVQRPDGVIRAASVEIEFGEAELNTLYVQNTGTDDTPAGFLISDLNLGDDGEGGLPANSIDLIINGQIRTANGTLTGLDVRDLLVEGRDLTPFTANSTINGCLLTGPCEIEQPEGPFPPGFTPLPGLPEEFELAEDNELPPPLFDNEDFIDDNIETTLDGRTSPIKPPHPLFNTSELSGKGDVDDPVSGSGNPALMETPAGNAACPAGVSQTGTCKQEKQP